MFKLEPMGSPLYSARNWDEKGKNMISNIYITFNNFGIKSIQFIYFHEGAHVESQKHGFSGGQHIERVRLEDDEYVTALSGFDHVHERRITSLTFHTNKSKHGPFCKQNEIAYYKREINVGIRDRSEFGGLFGSFSSTGYNGDCYLNSIGMYVFHNRSNTDAVPRTRFGATYDHQLLSLESLDDHTTPKIVDGLEQPMYVSHNRSNTDAVPRTRFGTTYDHQVPPLELLDHTTPRIHYQTPKIVDGLEQHMYVSQNRSNTDGVPRTSFGATYDHQLPPLDSLDHTTPRIHYQTATYDHQLLPLESLDHTTPRIPYQTPKIADGFPVKPSRR